MQLPYFFNYMLIFLCSFITVQAQEICNNGIDDDMDGLIDCGDPDCYDNNACVDAFECTNTLYQVISSTLKELNVATSSYDDIGIARGRYNGGGFNYQDGFIYGINKTSGQRRLWKIDNRGQETDLGIISGFGGIDYAGDFDQSGNLYTYKSGSFPELYYLDVNVQPLRQVTQPLTNLSGSSIPGAADITYNPVNNKFYGLSSGRTLIILDPVNLTVDLDFTVADDVDTSGAFGAAYSDSEGNSYFSNNNNGWIYKLSFDGNGRAIELVHVATGEPTNSNDGMACSNSLPPFETDCSDGIDNDGDGLVDCEDPDCFIDSSCPRLTAMLKCKPETGPNGIIPFHLLLVNNSEADAIDFSIEEILPAGMSLLYDTISVSGPAIQTDPSDRPTIGDANVISWGSLNLPIGDTLEIQYSVLVSEDVAEGVYSNSVSAKGVLLYPNLISHEILVSNYVIDEKQLLSCEPAFYQVYKKNGEPNFYGKLNVESGTYDEISPMSHQANGLGFDYQSGLVYGAEGRLFISLDSDGIVENLGEMFNEKVYVGDVDTLGNWWGKDGNDMVKVHIESILDDQLPDLVERYLNAGMPGWDMAYNKDGNFYAVHNSTLYKFDPTTGEQSTIGTLIGDAVPASGFGAQWTGSDGRLYISNNASGEIFRVDVVTRDTKLMMKSTAGLRFNDGFSCPLELPAPLTFDHHDYSLFPAASIFTYSQHTNGVPDFDAVWAGSGVDFENGSNAYITADVDSYDDGLNYSTYLPSGTITNWEVLVNTNFEQTVDIHYGLWIDWDADNVIDEFYNGNVSTSGPMTVPVSISIPETFTDNTVAVRLIVSERALASDDLDLYEDDVTGEVEDYQFYGNTKVDCGNGIDDDNDGLIDCDDPDCYQNCAYTTTKSGFEGGLESNNRLSNLVNRVNYEKRLGKFGRKFTRDGQAIITKQLLTSSSHSRRSSQTPIEAYMPVDVLPNTESRISSPAHLVDITNASEIYAIDFYENDLRRGAVLGLRSVDGVYEHTKYVCDRLAGSKILDILTYSTELTTGGANPKTLAVDLVIPKLEVEVDVVEYAMSFSVRETTEGGDSQWILESHWNLADYTAGQDYLNFQVWASNVRDLEILVKDIFAKVTNTDEFGKRIQSINIGSSPVFYINSAEYADDKLFMNITNKSNLSSVNMTGTKSLTETDESQAVDISLDLSGAPTETIELDLGRLYDMGVTFYHESLNAHDVIFLSGGSWNSSYDQTVDVVASFESVPGDYFEEAHYELDRNIMMTGSVKNYINVFRSFNPNFTGVDVDQFDNLNFTISGQGTIEVAIMKESVSDFGDQGKYILELTKEPSRYSLTKNHFKNNAGESADWSDVFMVQFTLVGDGQNYQDFSLNISDLYWGPNQIDGDFMVYSPKSVIQDIADGHVANVDDGTDRGELVLDANFEEDELIITIENTNEEIVSIEDSYIDAATNAFQILEFEPTDLSNTETYNVRIAYSPKDSPAITQANLRLTIDGDDSYVINLKGEAICTLHDHVSTSAINATDLETQRIYRAQNTISSDAQISQRNITFAAGQEIVLEAGFEVGSKSMLTVKIDDACGIE